MARPPSYGWEAKVDFRNGTNMSICKVSETAQTCLFARFQDGTNMSICKVRSMPQP
jgi:hypothetical protein